MNVVEMNVRQLNPAAYNPRKSAPLGVLIDRTGKIVKVHEGYNQGDERLLDEEVAALVDAPRAQ